MFLDLGEVAFCGACPMCPSGPLPSHPPGARDQPTQGSSDLCLQSQFCSLQDSSLLPSGVCPPMGEANLGACAGFLVGGTGACPLVARAGFVPLVIRAIPRGVLRGSSTFRKTLGSLWTAGWGCVPILLVVLA